MQTKKTEVYAPPRLLQFTPRAALGMLTTDTYTRIHLRTTDESVWMPFAPNALGCNSRLPYHTLRIADGARLRVVEPCDLADFLWHYDELRRRVERIDVRGASSVLPATVAADVFTDWLTHGNLPNVAGLEDLAAYTKLSDPLWVALVRTASGVILKHMHAVTYSVCALPGTGELHCTAIGEQHD